MKSTVGEMTNLFAYGTLMCEDIMREVSGCCLAHVIGVLKGFSRRPVRGQHYPAILPDENRRVQGMVYLNVPHSAWIRLDRFEGEMYARQAVQVAVDDGTTLPAETYVAKPEFLAQLVPSEWDFEGFLRNAKTTFQRQYQGYHSLETKRTGNCGPD